MSGPKHPSQNQKAWVKAALAKQPAVYSLARSGKAAWRRVHRLKEQRLYRERARRIQTIEQGVQQIEAQYSGSLQPPVLFFNASSHTRDLSFNAGVGLVTAWGLRMAGQPVKYLVCHSGLGNCVQGTNQLDLAAPPPCDACISFNNSLYPPQHTATFPPRINGHVPRQTELASLSLQELGDFRYGGLPIGELCLPSAQWILRRHDIHATPAGRQVLANYIVSAIGLAQEMEELLDATQPRSLLVFNGTFFPEATARAVAMDQGIPVVTYEGGHLPLHAFFSHGVATEYSVNISDSFQMGPAEANELDSYLAQRSQGNFTTVGTRFWPEMKGVSQELKRKAAAHRHLVTVFTNVVFDTSQVYSNTLFQSMFDWLDETMKLAIAHPETLFVVRTHPDELRAGKESQEPVGQWLEERGYLALANVAFIPPTEYTSSYELMQLSRFCLVYNSTVGLEATLLGVPVVTGGWSRYSQESVTHAPASREAYREMVGKFLEGNVPPVSVDCQQRARRYMYYSFFKAGLSLSSFIENQAKERPSYTVKPFQAQALHPDESPEMRIIYDGITHGKPFHYS